MAPTTDLTSTVRERTSMNRLRLSTPAPTVLAASITGTALLLTGCGTTSGDSGTATVTSVSAPSQPSSTASPAATTTTATVTATATATATARATVPAELSLPSEGEDGWTATSSWQFTPCDGVDVTLDAASDSRTIEHQVPESYSAETLAVFPDEQAATTFMAELEETARSCGTFSGFEDHMTTVAARPLAGKWAQGLVVYSFTVRDRSTSEDPAPVPGGQYLLAARTRNAVAISRGFSEWVNRDHPEPKPEAVAAYRKPLDEMAPALCSLAEENC